MSNLTVFFKHPDYRPLPMPKTLVGAVFTNSVTGQVVGCAVTFPQNGAAAGSCAVIEPHGF